MKVRILSLVVAVMLVFSVVACKKKEETTPLPQQGMGMPETMMPPQQQSQVVVPDAIKGKWSSVKIQIEDKTARKSIDVTIKLHSEYAIPNSNLKIQIGEFLPDFKMEGAVITSVSTEPNNPAVRVTIMEGGNEIFKGWLYSKFPAIHPFQHERYGLMLKEGVKG